MVVLIALFGALPCVCVCYCTSRCLRSIPLQYVLHVHVAMYFIHTVYIFSMWRITCMCRREGGGGSPSVSVTKDDYALFIIHHFG